MNQHIINKILYDKAIQDIKDGFACSIEGPVSYAKAQDILNYQTKMFMLLSLYGECRPSLN